MRPCLVNSLYFAKLAILDLVTPLHRVQGRCLHWVSYVMGLYSTIWNELLVWQMAGARDVDDTSSEACDEESAERGSAQSRVGPSKHFRSKPAFSPSGAPKHSST